MNCHQYTCNEYRIKTVTKLINVHKYYNSLPSGGKCCLKYQIVYKMTLGLKGDTKVCTLGRRAWAASVGASRLCRCLFGAFCHRN